jgi:hypothetical protein
MTVRPTVNSMDEQDTHFLVERNVHISTSAAAPDKGIAIIFSGFEEKYKDFLCNNGQRLPVATIKISPQ